jgi:hypothetical protein
VPADPETHRGALTLAEHRLGLIERSFTTLTVLMCICLAGGVAMSVFATAWFSIPAVILAGTAVYSVRQRSRFSRRVALLSDGFVR